MVWGVNIIIPSQREPYGGYTTFWCIQRNGSGSGQRELDKGKGVTQPEIKQDQNYEEPRHGQHDFFLSVHLLAEILHTSGGMVCII